MGLALHPRFGNIPQIADGASLRYWSYDPENAKLLYTDHPWEHAVQNALAIATTHAQFVERRIAGSCSG